MPVEPTPEGPHRSAPGAPGAARAAPLETLAYTCAFDLCGDPPRALELAKDLLKDVRKSGLKPPFADALLRRLALAEWTRRDRPRPGRLDSRDRKESAILLFFRSAWAATYEDLGIALSVSEDRSRHLVHKARIEQIATLTRLPVPKSECRRPRELLSDYREGGLSEPLAEDVKEHLRECRECSLIDFHLKALLSAAPKPLIEAPRELIGPGATRSALSFSLDGVSRTKRRAGVALLVLGLSFGLVELHPGLNALAAARMDRIGATFSRWRSRGQRLMEDLRVLRALAVGTVEGRTEELSQTLDEYVNSGDRPETPPQENKQTPDAVFDSREPNARPGDRPSRAPAQGSPGPQEP